MAFFSVSLATGLYYAAELAEENSVRARKIIKYWLFGVVAVQLALWLLGGLPAMQCIVGIVAHLVYSTLLKDYPFASFSSPTVILSTVLFMADTIQWYLYFIEPLSPGYSVSQVVGFFGTCVWPVPFGFFVTLSLGDQNLPGLGTIDGRGDGFADMKRRRGILGFLDGFLQKEPPAAYTKGC
eukprot:TRINITY_DN6827_c0_g2_i1.p2 TRINITY_DN6827_c0_g2~~TRINITY_DN6827_c0_g2_i1.p2  ORF type:complete len:182 (+),score=60.48 TRINITY_DN6827_c0_g2_i1:591-1136(+)